MQCAAKTILCVLASGILGCDSSSDAANLPAPRPAVEASKEQRPEPKFPDWVEPLFVEVTLAEFDAVEARIATDLQSAQAHKIAMRFVDFDTTEFREIFRRGGLEAGRSREELDAVLASPEFVQFARSRSVEPPIRERLNAMGMLGLPMASEVEGGCDQLQRMVDEHVAACRNLVFFDRTVRAQEGHGCTELRYDKQAYVSTCEQRGFSWARVAMQGMKESGVDADPKWGGLEKNSDGTYSIKE